MRYTFTKKERIKKRKDFDEILKNGARLQNKYLIMYVKKNLQNFNRLGILVSKKVKSAAIRNRLKRVVREAFRLSKGDVSKGYDIIILPNFNLPALTTDTLKNAFITLMLKVNQMNLKENESS